MNYEEKYKSALKWMQSLYGGLHGVTKEEAEHYFPELKVSEDERIRKELIDFLKLPHSRFVGNREHEKWIAWLEKQGKQDARYEDIEKKVEFAPSPYCRHWTIQDARDGDLIYVSTEEKGIQAIFHEYKNDTIFFHCYLCTDFVQGGCMPIGSVELTYPLQKTHYNRFFEKMHEAGYEWDGKKKELKKIESKTLDADKVIEWIERNASMFWESPCNPSRIVEQFKKDFGL